MDEKTIIKEKRSVSVNKFFMLSYIIFFLIGFIIGYMIMETRAEKNADTTEMTTSTETTETEFVPPSGNISVIQ